MFCRLSLFTLGRVLTPSACLAVADFLGPANATIAQLKLQHGDRIFAQHDAVEAAAAAEPAAMESPQKTHIVGHSLSGAQVVQILDESPQKMKIDAKDIKLDAVDEELYKHDGREKLAGAEKKGFGDQTIDSMDVEPYDDRLLK
eukprot:3683327-Rhodomonas_salina.1